MCCCRMAVLHRCIAAFLALEVVALAAETSRATCLGPEASLLQVKQTTAVSPAVVLDDKELEDALRDTVDGAKTKSSEAQDGVASTGRAKMQVPIPIADDDFLIEPKAQISMADDDFLIKQEAEKADTFSKVAECNGGDGEDCDVASAGSYSPPSPEKGSCAPICKWSCDTPTCEQECEPICQAPRCETRCAKVELKGCQLECEEPECCTICPKHKCVNKECPACSTKCSDPRCKLKCPQEQQCKSICESPICKWQCKSPKKCPKPNCKLQCEKPQEDCLDDVKQSIPPLKKGELKVSSFVPPPSSLLQVRPGVSGSPRQKPAHSPSMKEARRVASVWVETSEGRSLMEFPVKA